MSATLVRFLAATLGSAVLLACMAWTSGSKGLAQAPKAAKDPEARPLTADDCIACHGGKTAPIYKLYSQEEFRDGKKLPPRTDFMLFTEHPTWKDDDLHSEAYRNIIPGTTKDGKPNLAARMQEVLAASPTRDSKTYKVNSAAECLTCHSFDRAPGSITDPATVTAERFIRDDGVSCGACHGLVTNSWIGPHSDRDRKWRETTPEEKRKYGQIDLRDPLQRAEKCASCHIGNKSEGKFVTHEIYAAGHPPLPPFELVTYCRDQPRHYMPLKDNKAIAAMPPAQQSLFHFHKGNLTDTREFAVGTLAAFESTMKLLSEDAKASMESGNLLDFAHFDCFACHHDLKVDSDRQRPRKGITPGRPIMRPWATQTLQAVVAHAESTVEGKGKFAESNKALETGLNKLNSAFNARAFGDPKLVSTEAGDLAKLCGQLRVEMQNVNYSREEAIRLYGKLAERLKELRINRYAIDHDTAQQMAWGLVILQEELTGAKQESPTLDAVVKIRLRGTDRESVEKRLDARYLQIYGFRRNAFLDAGDQFLKSFNAK